MWRTQHLEADRFIRIVGFMGIELSKIKVHTNDTSSEFNKERQLSSMFGASSRTRTHNLLITNQLHYQLCYAGLILY